MKIKTIFYTFFLLCLLIINTTTNADNSNLPNSNLISEPPFNRRGVCKQFLSYYGININVRSPMGWKRVIKNNNLYLYSNDKYYNISYKNKYILEQCIIEPELNNRQIFDRGDQQ